MRATTILNMWNGGLPAKIKVSVYGCRLEKKYKRQEIMGASFLVFHFLLWPNSNSNP